MDVSGDRRIGLLVRGQFDSGDFAAFTGLGTVEWQGVTYSGVDDAIEIGETSGSTADGKAGLSITLSGVNPEVIALAELEEFQRRRVTVYLATFDDEGVITDGDVYFDGLADDLESDDNPDNPVLTLHCEQRALDLSRPRPFKYLPEDQKRRFPGDTIFDQVQIIQNQEDTWGR
ncbi:hypothetical protein [uncultured Roseobacter sp.]|uniref:hypothetical protein n=1 Tax=uncultured Roseobacter sp. TaxID=114847 RepID=UPI0026285512|nr:hypothetical protein [uncultured Roseobacter sp.]